MVNGVLKLAFRRDFGKISCLEKVPVPAQVDLVSDEGRYMILSTYGGMIFATWLQRCAERKPTVQDDASRLVVMIVHFIPVLGQQAQLKGDKG